MKAKLIVEGREFPVEINDTELEKLIKPQRKTGYERTNGREGYYMATSDGEVMKMCDNTSSDANKHRIANYYSDITVASHNVRADTLMRQLRRFAVEHRTTNIYWSDTAQDKFNIRFNYRTNELCVGTWCMARDAFGVYFDSEETAELAIETFHDELIWYFTEYKDSL